MSGSPRRSGANSTNSIRARIKSRAPRMSLMVSSGWNGILSVSDEIPVGLLDPVSWRNSRWTIASAAIMNGRMK